MMDCNDNDGLNDAFDLDCFNATDNREASSVSNCLDGADNDGDGWVDTLDNDCESGDESGGYSVLSVMTK